MVLDAIKPMAMLGRWWSNDKSKWIRRDFDHFPYGVWLKLSFFFDKRLNSSLNKPPASKREAVSTSLKNFMAVRYSIVRLWSLEADSSQSGFSFLFPPAFLPLGRCHPTSAPVLLLFISTGFWNCLFFYKRLNSLLNKPPASKREAVSTLLKNFMVVRYSIVRLWSLEADESGYDHLKRIHLFP